MGLFHVYVEAPDRSPETVQRVAEAIGQKFGVPAAELEKRLAAGRFRVKANVDRATADTYARSLADSGAIVKVEDAVPTQPVPVVAPPAHAPGMRPSTPAMPPRENRTSTPPAGAARSGSSSLPPATKSQPIISSGLSAAFSGSAAETDLGALSSDALNLSSLDGKDTGSQTEDVAPPSVSFAPPAQAAGGPAQPAKPSKPPKPPKPKDEPVDLFAPPDAEEAQFKVDLATDEIEHRQARAAAAAAAATETPPAGTPVVTPQLTAAKKKPTPVPGVPVTVASDAQETPRGRFAAGVLIAIIVGFVPAHFIAASRETSAFEKADKAVIETQAGAIDPDSYARLDEFRAKQLEFKENRKFSFAWQSMLIWAVVGGAFAYAWFYRVPWDKLGKKPAV